jgi:zinc metalloprotease ZmpA
MPSRHLLPLLAAALFLFATDCAHAANPAVGRALDTLRTQGRIAKASPRDAFVARDVIVDADGTEHVRFDRTYAGLPVMGGDLVVHSRRGRAGSLSLSQHAPLDITPHPTLKADDAVVIAGTAFGTRFEGRPESTLLVYARSGAPRLAWRIRLHNDEADRTYIVDAHDGHILDRWSNRHSAAATGTARTLYSGDVPLVTNAITGGYELRDPSRGGGYTIDASNSRTSGQVYKDADNLWGNRANTDAATAAAEAQYGAAITWDYYRNVHARSGIGNDGRAPYSRVHYGRRYSNAFWNDTCFCMTYGDGDGVNIGPLVALDIVGHELSHGVNSRTANLIYSGESGGLNEANSDILGTMIDFYAGNRQDVPDYLIGESIFLANATAGANPVALRYMFNPARDGRSPNCYVSTLGNLDVHYSSGVANLFFYLLAEGTGARTYAGVNHTPATCNGASFAGIGRAKAEKIWYRALTVYFTSNTNYAGARVATISAAKDLYGATSVEAARVASAWSAVRVN